MMRRTCNARLCNVLLRSVLRTGLLIVGLLATSGCDSVKNVTDLESLRGLVDQTIGQTVSADQIMVDLEKSEKQLSQLYQNISSENGAKTLEGVGSTIERIQADYAKLGAKTDLPSKLEQEAQMISLRSHYLASQMIPTLRESVATQADQIMQMRPESADATIAKVLKFCSKLNLGKKISPRTLRAVGGTARSFASRAQGVALYSMVAQAYWKYGQAESAEQVLKAGISQYRECKEKMPLVNQMIDQGHRDPTNKGRLCQEAFQRSLRAKESLLSGSDTKKVKFRS